MPLEASDTISESLWQRYQNTLKGLFVLVATLFIAAAGFRIIEGEDWSWPDALYMAVITMSTVGYAEVHPLSEEGRLFGLAVIIIGVSAFAYTFASIGEYMVTGRLRGDLQLNRTKRDLIKLDNHHVLVGYGHTGAIVASELKSLSNEQVVIIDVDKHAAQKACDDGFIAIVGDAGQDEVFLKAGIQRAKSLVCTVSSDSIAVMAVLSAQALAPNLKIVARAMFPDAESKLRRAGATEVVSTYHIAGRSIAHRAAQTSASHNIDVLLEMNSSGLRWDQVEVSKNSIYAGSNISDSKLTNDCDAHILAVRKTDTGEVAPVDRETVIHPGDTIIMVGMSQQVSDAITLINRSRRATN